MKNNALQQRIKIMRSLVLNQRLLHFVTSDFPAENPRTQTTHYSYT